MKINSSVSIVIPTHNRKEKLVRLLNSIKASEYPQEKIEVIVVDDASTDGTFEIVRRLLPGIKILRNEKEKFPSACRNLGIKKSSGDYIFLVDDDNVICRDTIHKLVRILKENENVGICGPIAYYYRYPNKIWCAGAKLIMPIFMHRHFLQNTTVKYSLQEYLIECDYIPNAFMIKKSITKSVGFFDERLPIGWEECDFALRIKKKGYKILVLTTAKIFHDIPATIDVHITEKRAYWRGRNRIIFYKKHMPLRCFFIFIDLLGFIILLLKTEKMSKNIIFQYIRGIKDGIQQKLNA